MTLRTARVEDYVRSTDDLDWAGVSASGADVIDSGSFSATVEALGSDDAQVDIAGVRFSVRYAVWKK